MPDTAHSTLLQLLHQYATGALTDGALRIMLEAPALRNALAIGEFILQIQRPAPIPAFQVPFPPAPLIGRTQELDALYERFQQLNAQQH